MEQWLYILGPLVVLAVAWRFLVRPWLERRAGPVDDQLLSNRAAAQEARARQKIFRGRSDDLR